MVQVLHELIVAVASLACSAITHIPCAVYSRSPVTEKDSKRAIVGSTESQQLYPKVYSFGQTESTRLPIPEGCLISESANGQSGDQQPQLMAEN